MFYVHKFFSITLLLLSFNAAATMVNRGDISRNNLVVEEPLQNSGSINVANTLSLYDTVENSGTIEAGTILVNDTFKNSASGSVNATTVFIAAGCRALENQGVLVVGSLHLPAYGTRLKLSLNKQTSIGSLYRGEDYLGGISFQPRRSRNQSTVMITDEQGTKHTFSGTTQNLENVLEKAINEKMNVLALLAYLRSMTR